MQQVRVKWYRNASEKDQDNVKGEGVLMAIMPMQNNAGGTVVIADDDGNFVEKELSLIKMDNDPLIDTTALQIELDRTVEANGKLSDDLNVLKIEIKTLKEQLNKKVTTASKSTKLDKK